jgi:hypothetical protein
MVPFAGHFASVFEAIGTLFLSALGLVQLFTPTRFDRWIKGPKGTDALMETQSVKRRMVSGVLCLLGAFYLGCRVIVAFNPEKPTHDAAMALHDQLHKLAVKWEAEKTTTQQAELEFINLDLRHKIPSIFHKLEDADASRIDILRERSDRLERGDITFLFPAGKTTDFELLSLGIDIGWVADTVNK